MGKKANKRRAWMVTIGVKLEGEAEQLGFELEMRTCGMSSADALEHVATKAAAVCRSLDDACQAVAEEKNVR